MEIISSVLAGPRSREDVLRHTYYSVLFNTKEDVLMADGLVQYPLNKPMVLLSWLENVKSLFSWLVFFLTIMLGKRNRFFFLRRRKTNKNYPFNASYFSVISKIMYQFSKRV